MAHEKSLAGAKLQNIRGFRATVSEAVCHFKQKCYEVDSDGALELLDRSTDNKVRRNYQISGIQVKIIVF